MNETNLKMVNKKTEEGIKSKKSQVKKEKSDPKKRITLRLDKYPEAVKRFAEIEQEIEGKSLGNSISASKIFAEAIMLLEERHIRNIVESSLTSPMDVMKYQWRQEKESGKTDLSFEEFLFKRGKFKTIN